LEQLADPARDVMDLVMAGPESESVWSLFQEEEEGKDEELGGEGQKTIGGGSANVGVGREEDVVMQADIGILYDRDDQLEYM